MSSVDNTLAEREIRYGDFSDNAEYAQKIKHVIRQTRGWLYLDPVKREALDLIASKIGRLLSGDPYYKDNWHDIAGYARLAESRIEEGDTCQAATIPSTSSSSRKPLERSKSEKPETRLDTTLNGKEKSTKATVSMSTTAILLRRAAAMKRRTGGSGRSTRTGQKGT